jgi:hypothetical protein
MVDRGEVTRGAQWQGHALLVMEVFKVTTLPQATHCKLLPSHPNA